MLKSTINATIIDRGWLSQDSVRMAEDSFHFSKEGHADAARRVQEIVDRVGVRKNPRVNDFESFDRCVSWYEDGVVPNDVQYSPNGYLHPPPPPPALNRNKKRVLSYEGGKGSMTLTNPFPDSQYLIISYLTSTPAPSKFPEVEVFVSTQNTTTILDPNLKGNWGTRAVQTGREICLGKVPPGDTTLFFSTLNESSEPFSLMSYGLTSVNPDHYRLE